MATNWIWRFTSTPAAELPAWAKEPDMFTGKYVSPTGLTTLSGAATVSGKSSSISGKVTNGFIKALCRATMIANGATDAYGSNDSYGLAEYTANLNFEGTDVGFGERIAVCYSKTDGAVSAKQGDKAVLPNKMTSAPFFLCLWTEFTKDPEFSVAFDNFTKADDADFDTKRSAACMMANAAYYKTRNILFSDADKISRLSNVKASSQALCPTVYDGVFEVFSKSNNRSVSSTLNSKIIETKDFIGAYSFFDADTLSDSQKELIPRLDERYVVGEDVINICKHIKATSNRKRPIRNILLRGEPGVGKTELYVGVAAGCGLPLYSFAANAMTEPFDLFGQFVPVDEDGQENGPKLSIETILQNMPSVEDMTMDPVLAYQTITGTYNPDATSIDCMSASFKAAEKSVNQGGSQPRFKFVPGQLIYALKEGGVWGFDEVTLPQNAGVVPALNPAMDSTQSITLPTGEIINRHPNCIFIGTTNVDLEGCRRMNQAWQDRCQLIIDVQEPSDNELIARVKSMTDFDDATDGLIVDLPKFIRAYKEIKDLAKKKHLDDGIVGPRKLADWITSTLVTHDALLSANMTIISGATADERGISELREKLTDLI